MSKWLCKILAVILAAFMVSGSFSVPAVLAETAGQTTAGESTTQNQPAQSVGEWKEIKKYFYYYQDGKKLTGVKEIGANTYYFSSTGKQITGWRKIGDAYYFFKIANKAGGYMVKNKRVNGIKLGADGKAKLNTKRAKRKTKLMARCAKIMDQYTKPGQSKANKLKKAFQVAKKKYPRKNIHHWRKSKDWDIYYAEYIINHRNGDCYCQGAFLAYLANAIGYSNVKAISSGGHGWAQIDNKVYDPNWSFIIGDRLCYAVTRAQSGKGRRQPWFACSKYKKDLRK